MRVPYYLSAICVLAALLLAVFASDARDAARETNMQAEAVRAELAQLQAEVAAMQDLAPWPLRFAPDAMAEFFTRTVEAGEVLGAGVRVQPRESAYGARAVLAFSPFRQGVQMCPVTLQAGLEASGAAAILAMFEEELADLPVAVRKITARNMNDTVVMSMDVDVFGR